MHTISNISLDLFNEAEIRQERERRERALNTDLEKWRQASPVPPLDDRGDILAWLKAQDEEDRRLTPIHFPPGWCAGFGEM